MNYYLIYVLVFYICLISFIIKPFQSPSSQVLGLSKT